MKWKSRSPATGTQEHAPGRAQVRKKKRPAKKLTLRGLREKNDEIRNRFNVSFNEALTAVRRANDAASWSAPAPAAAAFSARSTGAQELIIAHSPGRGPAPAAEASYILDIRTEECAMREGRLYITKGAVSLLAPFLPESARDRALKSAQLETALRADGTVGGGGRNAFHEFKPIVHVQAPGDGADAPVVEVKRAVMTAVKGAPTVQFRFGSHTWTEIVRIAAGLQSRVSPDDVGKVLGMRLRFERFGNSMLLVTPLAERLRILSKDEVYKEWDSGDLRFSCGRGGGSGGICSGNARPLPSRAGDERTVLDCVVRAASPFLSPERLESLKRHLDQWLADPAADAAADAAAASAGRGGGGGDEEEEDEGGPAKKARPATPAVSTPAQRRDARDAPAPSKELRGAGSGSGSSEEEEGGGGAGEEEK